MTLYRVGYLSAIVAKQESISSEARTHDHQIKSPALYTTTQFQPSTTTNVCITEFHPQILSAVFLSKYFYDRIDPPIFVCVIIKCVFFANRRWKVWASLYNKMGVPFFILVANLNYKYLKKSKVPVSYIGVGPVTKDCILMAMRPLFND